MRKLLFAGAAVAALAVTGSAFAETANDTFNVTATTEAAIAVSCTDLQFGTLSVRAGNPQTTVTVAASSGATASSGDSSVVAGGTSGNGACTITNEGGADATAALSGGGGTFTGTTLSGASLSDGAATPNTLGVAIELSKASAITNETVYVGGTLTIPASHTTHGAYSETITLTVTD